MRLSSWRLAGVGLKAQCLTALQTTAKTTVSSVIFHEAAISLIRNNARSFQSIARAGRDVRFRDRHAGL